MPVTTWVAINAANAHQIWFKLGTAPPILQNRIIPTQTKLAAHIAIIVKTQSNPPMIMPFTGYARPFRTCVRRTAGKIAAAACWTATFVVKPLKIESLWTNVVSDKTVATPPPINNEVLMRCLTSFARTCSE